MTRPEFRSTLKEKINVLGFMQRFSVVLLVLALCAGCAAKSIDMLPEPLITLFSQEATDAFETLNPDKANTESEFVYSKSCEWFGETMDTGIAFENDNSGKITFAQAQAPVNGDIAGYAESVYEKAMNVMGDPVSFACIVDDVHVSCSSVDEVLGQLENEENCVASIVFMLPGTQMDDRKFLHCIFFRIDSAEICDVRYCLSNTPS